MAKRSESTIFADACNGYGFEEIDQTPEGVYCTGCYVAHKRPSKMYANGPVNHEGQPKRSDIEVLCRFRVARLYDPEGVS